MYANAHRIRVVERRERVNGFEHPAYHVGHAKERRGGGGGETGEGERERRTAVNSEEDQNRIPVGDLIEDLLLRSFHRTRKKR